MLYLKSRQAQDSSKSSLAILSVLSVNLLWYYLNLVKFRDTEHDSECNIVYVKRKSTLANRQPYYAQNERINPQQMSPQ